MTLKLVWRVLQFDFDIHSCGKLDAHESLDSLLRGLYDVDKTLMCSVLELFAAVLIFMNSAEDGDDLFIGGKRNGTGNGSAVALCGFDDLFSSLIDQEMVIGLESDSGVLFLMSVSLIHG